MTTTVKTKPAPPAGQAKPRRAWPLRLVHSELLKLRTTNTWWLFLIGLLVAVLGSLAIWMLIGHFMIDEAEQASGEPFTPPEDFAFDEATLAELEAEHERRQDVGRTLNQVAGLIYPAGRLFGVMFALLLGVLVITNEFRHQTATATFLTTPTRIKVVLGKLATAILGAGFFWLAATAVSLLAGIIYFALKGYGPQLDSWPVLRAILLNGLAYGLWGVIGLGIGTIIRNQLGAVLVAGLTYLVGGAIVNVIIVPVFLNVLGWDWIVDVMVLWPGVATSVMISPEPVMVGAPDWWVGLLVLVGYGLLFGVIGALLTRRRDIS